MPIEQCAVRARLLRNLGATIEMLRHAKTLHAIAKKDGGIGSLEADKVVAFAIAVVEGGAEVRAAQRALREHIEQHGCKL